MEGFVIMNNGKTAQPMNVVELALILSQEIEPERVADVCLSSIASFFTPEVEN